MTARRVIFGLVVVAWLAAAAWAAPFVAGAAYLLTNKTNPMVVEQRTWSQAWDNRSYDPTHKKRLQLSMGAAVLLLIGVPLILYIKSRSNRRSLHGDARFATAGEIEKAGLLSSKGLILGKYAGKFLMVDAPKFIFLCAPTRSGKGVGTIIPNLLNWSGSAIVVDIKGENFQVTSGFRAKHGQEVFKFSPFDPEFQTHRCNVLSYVNRDPRFVVGELQSIGYMLYPKRDGGDAFWNDQARNLFVGVALYCIESQLPVTLGGVLRRSHGGGKPKEFWAGIVEASVTPSGTHLSEGCLNALRQFVGNSDNTLTSILSTFNAPLGVFANPLVDVATSGDDFDLRDVRRKLTTIYVVIPPNRLAEASLLVNLFFSVAIDENTKVLPERDPTLKHLCCLFLDEMPALGRVDKYEKSIGFIAGYGLRVLSIAQSVSQLQDRHLYGVEGTRTLVANHMIQIMYAPREQKDAQEYSEVLGYFTERGVSTGTSRTRGKGAGPTRSENISDQKRALMMPRELGDDRVIVMADNCKPIFGDKIRYFDEPVFKARVLAPVTVGALDVDAHMARMEGRIRTVEFGERVDARHIVHDEASIPAIQDPQGTLASDIDALASWLMSTVQWVKDDSTNLTTTEAFR
jgi:type IV secretion system protein VirD4